MKMFVPINKMFYKKLCGEAARSPHLDPGHLGAYANCSSSQLYHLEGITVPHASRFPDCKKGSSEALSPTALESLEHNSAYPRPNA